MLVKELDFVLADVNKLSRYANMTIEEYADEIESQLNRGESPNLFYKDIYEKLIQKGLIEKKPEPVEDKKNWSNYAMPFWNTNSGNTILCTIVYLYEDHQSAEFKRH